MLPLVVALFERLFLEDSKGFAVNSGRVRAVLVSSGYAVQRKERTHATNVQPSARTGVKDPTSNHPSSFS